MQLGEGLCKLRKMGFDDGPFLQFEREISVALEFIYQTQKELAACGSFINCYIFIAICLICFFFWRILMRQSFS